MNEIERRLFQAANNRRDLQQDFVRASEGVRNSHRAYKNSLDRSGTPSQAAQESYAKALRELDLASRCLDFHKAEVA